MHTELFKKDRTNILKYLQKLGENRKIYSAHRDSFRPLFPDMDGYIYATEKEIIVVLIDSGKSKRFDEKDDMAWDLALTCELYRNRLQRLSKHVPDVYGVLVTSDDVLSHYEIKDELEILDFSIIDNVEGLDRLSLPVNTDETLPVAFPLIFLYEAEFTEADYAYAEYSLISLIDPDITTEERDEELNYLREEFGLDDMLKD
jgi:hypothetical protein